MSRSYSATSPLCAITALGVITMLPSCVLPQPATGPLQVSPDNPRYFADPAGKIVYLTGSHTWANLKDMGDTDPPAPFDYSGYLDMLQQYGHNFIRLWTWELSRYGYGGKTTYCEQFPWPRTGPGNALDGKTRFDLSRLHEPYFHRLRERVQAAGERGIYVSIMLFEGHGLHASDAPWCWDGHPFNAANNINGVDGDPDGDGRGLETQALQVPALTAVQEAYVLKVIQTVNDLDNVLYEIVNESGAYSTPWQYHLIDFIHEREKAMAKQHPVGMTFQYHRDEKLRGSNQTLFESPADWISPNPRGGYSTDPPDAGGAKVILNDTDHLWGIGGSQEWVWKSFCRGMKPIFMDPCSPPIEAEGAGDPQVTWTDHLTGLSRLDAKWDPIRRSMGYTLGYASRMNLARAVPHGELSSTTYCLADPGSEYLVYAPKGGQLTIDLSGATGAFTVEWFDPSQGKAIAAGSVEGGAKRVLKKPFEGDAVLYLRAARQQ